MEKMTDLDAKTLDEWMNEASVGALLNDWKDLRLVTLISALRDARGELRSSREEIEKLNTAILVWRSDCLDNGKIIDEQEEEISHLRGTLTRIANDKQHFEHCEKWKLSIIEMSIIESFQKEAREALAWKPEGKTE